MDFMKHLGCPPPWAGPGRSRLAGIFFGLLAGGLFALAAEAAPQNILLIIADDFGADASVLYNSTNNGAVLPPTPNLTSLAQSGVVFRNAYANPVCSPTRACLLTGRHAFRTGVGDVILGGSSGLLAANEFTLPRAFATNAALGYHLAQFGKWHLANASNTGAPLAVGGWTNYMGSLAGAIANYTNWVKTVNGTSATTTNYATTDLVNDAAAWIQARGTNAWFAWIAFNAPHTPFHKPPTNLAPHYATLPGTPADINARPWLYFDAMTEAMDTEMGRLLAAVNRTNTHIIFLGDNGSQPNVIQPPFSPGGGKDTLYEGGIKVPMVISGPAVVNPGRTNDTLVHAVDVFATILEMAGMNLSATVPTNVTIDSQSLLAALSGTNTLSRLVYAEKFDTNAPTSADGRVLRNTRYKLIRFNNGHDEFYDLLADPYEATNLLNTAMTSVQSGNYYALMMKLGDYQIALTPPVITGFARSNAQFTVTVRRTNSVSYGLWRAADLHGLAWAPLTNAVIVTNSATVVTLADTNAPAAQSFYRVVSQTP